MTNNMYTSCPATETTTRYGRIRKEIRIWSPSDWGKGNYSIVGVEINTWDDLIEIKHLLGTMPLAKNLFLALLADRDIRRAIKAYQEKGRVQKYKIWHTEGMSGRKDIFMTFSREIGSFAVTRTMHLCHISGFGRLNEGFGEDDRMYIGDFVEMCKYLGLTDDMSVKSLRKKAGGVKYIKPQLAEDDSEFTTEVTKLL